MQFFLFGINHQVASLQLRDQFAVDAAVLRKLYKTTPVSENAEYVVISTCNRTECILFGLTSDVYNIQDALSKHARTPWPEQAILLQDEAAVSHLLEMTAGLNSLVIGDAQILGQVKNAYSIAVEEERVGAVLHRLMHTAFSTSKRVASETNLTGGTASIAGTAAGFVCRAMDGGKTPLKCLVIGAGHMGRLVIDALIKEDGINLTVTNRTTARSEALCSAYNRLEVVSWEERYSAIALSDVVVVTSGASEYVVNPDELAAQLINRRTPAGDRILIIDISVPRNVNPAVGENDICHLFDLDVLQEKIDTVLSDRKKDQPAAKIICQEMLADFVSWCFHHQALQPAIRAILDTFDNIRRQEISRHAHRFQEIDLVELDRITKSIMQKVLAVPVVRLKNVGPDQIDYVNGVKLLKTLFARTSCEAPDYQQFNHSRQMLDVILQQEMPNLSSLSACPFDEEKGEVFRSEDVNRIKAVSNSLKLGTRGSALALWQADHVQGILEGAGLNVLQERITTRGDQILDKPLALIEGKSLFTRELDVALIEGRIDLAVHSLKDLPSQLPEGLVLAAISQRENPLDAFIAHPSYKGSLEDLPEGAMIGTSSLRRTAQLKAWRPDLEVVSIRGNVDTRLSKLDASAWHGIVLAAAGLIRLGLADRIHTYFDKSRLLPAVGQGALGIVCAEHNKAVAALLKATLHDEATAVAVRSERAFLNCLEGSCHVPVGGFAQWDDQGGLMLTGLVASLDGAEIVRGTELVDPECPEEAGITLAQRLLTEGAGEILQLVKL